LKLAILIIIIKIKQGRGDAVIVCLCRAVSDRTIAREVANGARTPSELAARCGAGTGCGACVPTLERICSRACGPDERSACDAASSTDAAA
jgi:bacterioferritin-associated ferredoxin